jgi:hypothetical protein
MDSSAPRLQWNCNCPSCPGAGLQNDRIGVCGNWLLLRGVPYAKLTQPLLFGPLEMCGALSSGSSPNGGGQSGYGDLRVEGLDPADSHLMEINFSANLE